MFAGRPIIGIVGGIGAGKSHVARLFEQAGCCRIASDEMVRAAYTHPAVKRAVAERFGAEVIDETGQVDRRRISDIVFRDAAQRKWLEALLHPVANQARVEVMEQAARDPSIVAYVWDSPLLLETGLDELCDTVVFVDAPRADRVRRVAERGWGEQELDRRENVQMPLDKKGAKAEYHLLNADASPATAEGVAAMLKEILKRFGPDCAATCDSPCACQCRAAPVDGGAPAPDTEASSQAQRTCCSDAAARGAM